MRDPEDAASFCERLGVPVYDAAVVGYPKRMRDFEKGRAPATESIDRAIEDLERRLDEAGEAPSND